MARPQASERRARQSMKMVVTGPYGVGKTTLIESISEITVLSTERKVSEGASPTKGDTTVAMDFGRLTIDQDLALYLFGTPGQRRFDFMWEILSEGMLGFIVMVDVANENSVDEAGEILSFFRDRATVPYVIAVNKVSQDAEKAIEQVRRLMRVPEQVRVVAFDARERESVKTVLLELLYAVLDEVEAALPAPA